jgi:hypothetical protein
MYKYFNLPGFLIILLINGQVHSADIKNNQQKLRSMSCNDLMHSLMWESSYSKTLHDRDLAFAYERYDKTTIMIKVVKKIENNRNAVYANLELDLAKNTLNNIDRDQPIPITINQKYIPFISKKCTPDMNWYINTGRLPEDGD